MNQFPSKNYFTLPNEIFRWGWAQVRSRSTPTSAVLRTPVPTSAGPATPRSEKLLAVQKIRSCSMSTLSEKGLISTEPTSVLTKSRIKKNGNLRYTIRPIHEAVEIFHTRQLSAVERTTERRQIHRKLSAVNLLPGA